MFFSFIRKSYLHLFSFMRIDLWFLISSRCCNAEISLYDNKITLFADDICLYTIEIVITSDESVTVLVKNINQTTYLLGGKSDAHFCQNVPKLVAIQLSNTIIVWIPKYALEIEPQFFSILLEQIHDNWFVFEVLSVKIFAHIWKLSWWIQHWYGFKLGLFFWLVCFVLPHFLL